MDIKILVNMANRIGEFFSSMPDREEALEGIATHLRNYWEPRMRLQLLTYADRPTSDSGLSEIVALALDKKRAIVAPEVK